MPNQAEIRLKMLGIDRVEAHNSRVGKEIQLGNLGAEDIRAAVAMEQGLEFVEGSEERDNVLFVGCLGRSETGFVDAVADEVCEPGFDVVDLVTEVGGVERCGDGGWLREGGRKPFHHFGALVADDFLGFFIPDHRNGVAAFVGWVVAEVELVQELAVEDVVWRAAGIGGVEAPAWFAFWVGAHNGDGEVVLEVE